MPPMFINVGAYVDDDTMVDSHALVGSCAQIGKRVHLSAAAQIGGVHVAAARLAAERRDVIDAARDDGVGHRAHAIRCQFEVYWSQSFT